MSRIFSMMTPERIGVLFGGLLSFAILLFTQSFAYLGLLWGGALLLRLVARVALARTEFYPVLRGLFIGSICAPGLIYGIYGYLLEAQGYSPYSTPKIEHGGSARRVADAIELTGMIDGRMAQQFDEILSSPTSLTIRWVSLNSPGGMQEIADEIAGQIARRQLTARVAAGNSCKSACVSIFAAAPLREADPTALFMFHGSAKAFGFPYLHIQFEFDAKAKSVGDDLQAFDALSKFLRENNAFAATKPIERRASDLAAIDPTFLTLR
ncbi:hypothetical protein [Rhizobium leguminosarum]|uniref:hypothetical protein n=1 Tax=Rhizobium leguminosarum TaxID=384 RepID=UPI001440F004|nr:hypothetical protein [Rhizobium leguminosarum]NKM95686.1 hypothetical protein [Rhizobium leguminosarum bv. viciae]